MPKARTLESIDSFYLRKTAEEEDKKNMGEQEDEAHEVLDVFQSVLPGIRACSACQERWLGFSSGAPPLRNCPLCNLMENNKEEQKVESWAEQNDENVNLQMDESMDGRLIQFQMTVSETHPVKASDIIHALKKLGYLDKLGEVVLVFVVPRELLGKFKRQTIVPVNTPTGSDSIKEIKNIGTITASVLSKYGVSTIDQLEEKIGLYRAQKIKMKDPKKDKRAWDTALRCWEEHGQALKDAMDYNTVANISQYVCSLD